MTTRIALYTFIYIMVLILGHVYSNHQICDPGDLNDFFCLGGNEKRLLSLAVYLHICNYTPMVDGVVALLSIYSNKVSLLIKIVMKHCVYSKWFLFACLS